MEARTAEAPLLALEVPRLFGSGEPESKVKLDGTAMEVFAVLLPSLIAEGAPRKKAATKENMTTVLSSCLNLAASKRLGCATCAADMGKGEDVAMLKNLNLYPPRMLVNETCPLLLRCSWRWSRARSKAAHGAGWGGSAQAEGTQP